MHGLSLVILGDEGVVDRSICSELLAHVVLIREVIWRQSASARVRRLVVRVDLHSPEVDEIFRSFSGRDHDAVNELLGHNGAPADWAAQACEQELFIKITGVENSADTLRLHLNEAVLGEVDLE